MGNPMFSQLQGLAGVTQDEIQRMCQSQSEMMMRANLGLANIEAQGKNASYAQGIVFSVATTSASTAIGDIYYDFSTGSIKEISRVNEFGVLEPRQIPSRKVSAREQLQDETTEWLKGALTS